MNIYTPEGWLDFDHIAEVADRNNISFIFIIGKRQVGKTYGLIKYQLKHENTFIYMRRVRPELDMLCKDKNSPFEKFNTEAVEYLFRKESEYTAAINKVEHTDEGDKVTRIGMGAFLSGFANVRGMSGDSYTEWIFDEFIPEEHVFKVRNEGDAFNNAHVTISGNRELEGKKPIRVWLLANANDLNSGILEGCKMTAIIERMSLRGEESRVMPERGVMVILPESKVIMEKRKETALYKLIGGDSKFARMAYENEFAYNDYTDVSVKPLHEFNPFVTIGRITIHLHKNDKTLYVTDKMKYKPRYEYTDSDTHRNTFNRKFPEIKAAYLRGRVWFQDMRVKNYFLDIIDN